VLNFANPNTSQGGSYSGPLDGSTVAFLTVNGSGAPTGYSYVYFDSETSDYPVGHFTGYQNVSGSPLPEPQITIGEGWFYTSESPNGAYTWTQVLNP